MKLNRMPEEPKDQLLDTGAELLEIAGDQLLQEGLLKDIPILGTAISFARIGKTISDRVFLAKVNKFLFALSDVEEAIKQKFCEQLEVDEKLRRKTGEVVLLLLDQADDLEKPEILAKLFAAFMRGDISFDQFRRLSSAVDLAYVEDLKQLAMGKSTLESNKGLLRTGLTEIHRVGFIKKVKSGHPQFTRLAFNITDLGELFIQIMGDQLK